MGRRQTLNFNNKEFWSETEKIADEKLIYEFEEKIGHKLPESFIELSKMFHHGESQKARFYVNEDMSPTLSYMLSFNKDNTRFCFRFRIVERDKVSGNILCDDNIWIEVS